MTYPPSCPISGSSPRARGTRLRADDPVRLGRFIPAGAGNTPRRAAGGSVPPVHPRGRGEHACEEVRAHAASGSSPRARGTRAERHFDQHVVRFIPAGAGNTSRPFPRVLDRTVHPRGRGEHAARSRNSSWSFGSSPRARGTRISAEQIRVTSRFIPAGAGNTLLQGLVVGAHAVHPRGRGEHMASSSKSCTSRGSSPRARGTRRKRARHILHQRFIPAGAGNTRTARAESGCVPVHPRGRGEHAIRRIGNHRVDRFIPAGAGNTSRQAS